MKALHRIILLTLTLLVLVSSTGISVAMHLCNGELQDLSFLGTAADCPMEQQKEKLPACHNLPASDDADSDCCDDHTLVFEYEDATIDINAQFLAKTLDIKFVAAFQAIILQFFASETAPKPTYALYKSPPLARDIPVLVQSFLL